MKFKPSVAVAEAAERSTAILRELARREHINLAIDPLAILDRSDSLPLHPPTRTSPNGSCRLLPTLDGWIAVNLPRPDDRDLVPAWTYSDCGLEPWHAVASAALGERSTDFVERGASLGLAVAVLGDTPAGPGPLEMGSLGSATRGGRLRVLDLSSLWAGPLCGSILALMGHQVKKIESLTRPDPVRTTTPLLHERLNGLKECCTAPFDLATLECLIAEADVVITSARPRAFQSLGLSPEKVCAERPALMWIAITGYGWSGPAKTRVGFGDDCAVAGSLVDYDGGEPIFAGDAVADPLTGLWAAIRAIEAIQAGERGIIDAALANVAALASADGCLKSRGA